MIHRLPPWLWLVLSIISGTIATYMAMGWLKGQSVKQVKEPLPLAPVVVAAKSIGTAVSLAADQLVVQRWPKDNQPQGSFPAVDQVVGRVTAYPFSPGEPILEAKLAPKGAIPGLTALIPPDKRAITVKVDEASGVAGFINPDNRVDVIVGVDKNQFTDNPMAKTVLQNLRVIGTGQRIEKSPDGKPQVVPTVTLEVTPEEGERLALVAQEGHLRLALRGLKDDAILPSSGVTVNHVMKGGGKGDTVEIIRKNQRQLANF